MDFSNTAGTTLVIKNDTLADPQVENAPTSVPVNLTPGKNTLQVFQRTGPDAAPVDKLIQTIIVTTPQADGPAKPTVSKAFNNTFAKDNPVEGPALGTNDGVRVYGDYLRVEGALDPAKLGDLRFAVFTQRNNENEFFSDVTPNPTRVPSDGKWLIEVQLPPGLKRLQKGMLVAYAVNAGRHAYADNVVNFIIAEDRVSLNPPTIDSVTKGATDTGADVWTSPRTWVVTDPSRTFFLKGSAANVPAGNARTDSRIVVYQIVNGSRLPLLASAGNGFPIDPATSGPWKATVTQTDDGDYTYEAEIVQGNLNTEPSPRVKVLVRTKGPAVADIEPRNRLLGAGRIVVTVHFDKNHRLNVTSAEALTSYVISGPGITAGTNDSPLEASFDSTENAVTLTFPDYPNDGTFTILVKKLKPPGQANGLVDIYGNALDSDNDAGYSFNISRSKLVDIPSVAPGISASTGPYVPFTEWTKPRNTPDGFNPSDKVETRVARLYYYRDAHRVAQIVNRKVKSYNRQGVDMQRQLADKARNQADQRTVARQQAERAAIVKSQKTRAKERDLQAAQQSLNSTLQELTSARRQGAAATDPVVQQLDAAARSFSAQVNNLRAEVEQARDDEVAANELSQQAEAEEKLAREDQFRREVAAAHEDPDTYAAGKPNSDDPVEQVSISVIGEGLIQLRGPLKGINQIRTMIDQIDTPVGQVRVSVHSVQINGEKADRMEVVAKHIQTYIDHARFLTMQSSEMLRKAVVQVASRKAEEARGLFPGETQEDRDQRYLYAFFGKDFIEELRAMDSEFLSSGNKILSLHSMDTTSLSSALNLMALAKNSTRLEIFQEFDNMLQGQLPLAEANYLEAGMTCKTKHFPLPCRDPKFCPLAQNAKFESLKGFFDMQLEHDETMTPLQREFLRLAQIFKSRLVTEIEYKQRVMERAVIEERLGNRLLELQAAKDKEQNANAELDRERKALQEQQLAAVVAVQKLRAEATKVRQKANTLAGVANEIQRDFTGPIGTGLVQAARDSIDGARKASPDALNQQLVAEAERFLDSLLLPNGEFRRVPEVRIEKQFWKYREDYFSGINKKLKKPAGKEGSAAPIRGKCKIGDADLHVMIKDGEFQPDPRLKPTDRSLTDEGFILDQSRKLAGYAGDLKEAQVFTAQFSPDSTNQLRLEESGNALKEIKDDFLSKPTLSDVVQGAIALQVAARRLSDFYAEVAATADNVTDQFDALVAKLGDPRSRVDELYSNWVALEQQLLLLLADDSELKKAVGELFSNTRGAFQNLLAQSLKRGFAERSATESRRPLDHKKFLDMLIDDLEEKYIELLDGTRAHTANVDNYLKRLTTALDDDFNTQFYFPTFRYVREASQFYDVQFGQTETTSILANNRDFAKVDPSASMEFDLPKRDILLAEGINGAKAMMNDIGALANDPTFLAMAKMQSGNSPATPQAGSTSGFGVVRDVVPGLSASTSEQVLSQNANGGNQFGSNLENLIPDPAIYKFETGTGFEIRPVIQPDGQAVVFDFNYMYSTNIREPVRADEKHLGRIKRHYIDTDVQLSNFELREVSRYTVALKASRTSRGVPGFEDVPVVGVLFRPLPSAEASLQQNLIMAQATIFPTLFDLMGLRWAPAVADLDPLRVSNTEFVVRNRNRVLKNRVYDESSSYVDTFLRIPDAERRMDLYRSQETVPAMHPNGYQGPGLNQHDSELQEGYQPSQARPQEKFYPGESREGAVFEPGRGYGVPQGTRVENYPLEQVAPGTPFPEPIIAPASPIRNP